MTKPCENEMLDEGSLFPSEQLLSAEFCKLLRSETAPWDTVNYVMEFNYIGGRADIIAMDTNGTVLAFELKIERWKDAAQQAYKNTSFANKSYVVLPEAAARRAQLRLTEFRRRAVGLCYIKDGEIHEILSAPDNEPVLPWLTKIAVERLAAEKLDEFSE